MTVTDPNAQTPTTPTPAQPVPVPVVTQPEPQPAPEVTQKIKSQAAHFARHPEEFQAVLDELETSGVVNIRREVAEMKRKDFVRDVIEENGLSKEDAAFITGNTPEQIRASAAAYKARLDLYATKAGTPAPANTTEPEVIEANKFMQPAKLKDVPVIPEHQTGAPSSLEAAKANLAESLKGKTFVGF